jgi:hypothetical protein
MKPFATRRKNSLSAAALLALAFVAFTHVAEAAPAVAPTNDEQSLEKGAVADLTPPQKYQTAIREAGGVYKEALRECDQSGDDDRRVCAVEVKAAYERDMAQAKLIFHGREILQACVRG